MRKILSVIAMISFLALAGSALAQVIPPTPTGCTMRGDYSGYTTIKCPPKDSACLFTDTTYDCGACCVLDAVYKVSQWIMYIVIIIAIIFIVMGAFSIMSAAGSPEKVTTGRNYIIYAIIGMIVALLAWTLPKIVMTIVGLTS
jgi:amino acid transporter